MKPTPSPAASEAAQARTLLSVITRPEWLLGLVAAACVLGGLSAFYHLTVSSWGDLAGPLFGLASSLLFVLALAMQLREHRQAIEEMRLNNLNHAELLLVAKQEKEFNVCLQAIQSVNAELSTFSCGPVSGVHGIAEALRTWCFLLSPEGLSQLKTDPSEPLTIARNTSVVFPNYDQLDALNVHMYWVLHNLSRKSLAAEDKRYLYSLIAPVISLVARGQSLLPNVIESLEGLIVQVKEGRAPVPMAVGALQFYLNDMRTLKERKFYKEQPALDEFLKEPVTRSS